jgi:hypothetical protein
MFRGWDTVAQQEVVIILDEYDDRTALDLLRDRCKCDQIVCPVCNQPLIAKAGVVKIRHFAHTHAANCPSNVESVEVLLARAALYNWLVGKFDAAVRLEEHLPELELPRPLDCVVERSDLRLAYWITDRRMKVDDRDRLKGGLDRLGIKLIVLFTPRLMQRNENKQGMLNLSTTERQFLSQSRYELAYRLHKRQSTGSLFYLDGGNKTLITFRGMRVIEWPQQYGGIEIGTLLKDVRVQPTTGEFVLPGEEDHLRNILALHERLECERIEAEKRAEQQRFQNWAKPRQDRFVLDPMQQVMSCNVAVQSTHDGPLPPVEAGREGICDDCGQRTTDWWVFYGTMGRCRCNPCQRRQRKQQSSSSQ